MPLAHFRAGDVRKLIQHAEQAQDRWPTLTDRANPEFRTDGRDPLAEEDLSLLDRDDLLDTKRIPASLILVGDDGIYLMSNGKPALTRNDNSNKPLVVFAAEANPDTMDRDDCMTAKRDIFGGDDGTERIDVQIMHELVGDAPDDAYVGLEIDENQIGVSRSRMTAEQATAHWNTPRGPQAH